MTDKTFLLEATRTLNAAHVAIAGNESLFGDIFINAAGKAKDGITMVGGTVASGAIKTFKDLYTQGLKAAGANRILLSNLNSRIKRDELKESITFNERFLNKASTDGTPDSLLSGVDDLLAVFKKIDEYDKNIQGHYLKEIELIKSISKIDSPESAIKVIKGLDQLEENFPKVKFSYLDNHMSKTEMLPGMAVFTFDDNSNKLSIENESSPDASEVVQSFDKNDLQTLLGKLNSLIGTYSVISKSADKYANYIREFNTVLGKEFLHLEEIESKIGKNLTYDLKSKLKGNLSIFMFYSGFLPKAVMYLDDYVETLTSFFSKQFN